MSQLFNNIYQLTIRGGIEMLQFEVIHRKNNIPIFPVCNNSDDFLEKDSLLIRVESLERAMNAFFGKKISEIGLGEGGQHIDTCNALVKKYSNYGSIGDAKRLAGEFFGDIMKPTAILYDNIEGMATSISEMYQMSYCHYMLGRYYSMKGKFPSYCCSYSASNLLAAFWRAGKVSAVKACTSRYDHAYVIVPFILKEGDKKGVILIDPTSDQLVNDPNKKVRNLIRVITEKTWSYVTDWYGGEDLSADEVEVSACYGKKDIVYAEYMKEAFQNPVVVV